MTRNITMWLAFWAISVGVALATEPPAQLKADIPFPQFEVVAPKTKVLDKTSPTIRTEDCFVHWVHPNLLHTNRSTGEMTVLVREVHTELPRDKMGQLPGTRVTRKQVREMKHDESNLYVLTTTTSGIRNVFQQDIQLDIASATIQAFRLSDAHAIDLWEITKQPKESVEEFVNSVTKSFELREGGVSCQGKLFLAKDTLSD